MRIDWDENTATGSDCESSDEDGDEDDDNYGADEPSAGVVELDLVDNEELGLMDDEECNSDFSVIIDDIDNTDPEIIENDVLLSAYYEVVGDNLDKNIRASFW